MSDSPIKLIPNNAIWTPESQRIVLDALITQQRLGKKSESGFKKEAWVYCVNQLEAHDINRTLQQVKSLVSNVRHYSGAITLSFILTALKAQEKIRMLQNAERSVGIWMG